MFGADVWGIEIRDVGYLHARSGAAQAWLLLGDRDRARTLAEAELADARVSGGRRALGIALRVAGLATGEPTAWNACPSRSTSCASPRPCSSGRNPSPNSGPRCAGPDSGPPPGRC